MKPYVFATSNGCRRTFRYSYGGRITLGRNMASLEAYNGAGKIHTMGRNLPVKFNELPVNMNLVN